jgi:hypothetical protein
MNPRLSINITFPIERLSNMSSPIGIMKSKALSTSIPDQPFPIGIGLGQFVGDSKTISPNDAFSFRE